MLKELREALKAEIALVAPIRQKIRESREWDRYYAWNEKRSRSDTRRHLHLACCYLRGTPYRKCEANPATPPRTDEIRLLLEEYGCTEDVDRPIASWLDVAPVPVPVVKPVRVRRLYVVVRADLPPGAQAVQAAHAMREFAEQHPEIEKTWHAESNTVAMLAVPDEGCLVIWYEKLRRWGYAVAEFREPDLGNTLTAFCVEPRAGRLLRDVPLALRQAS